MKADLFDLCGAFIGTVTVKDARAFPERLKLDERPQGGIRCFVGESRTSNKFNEVVLWAPDAVPIVRLDPVE